MVEWNCCYTPIRACISVYFFGKIFIQPSKEWLQDLGPPLDPLSRVWLFSPSNEMLAQFASMNTMSLISTMQRRSRTMIAGFDF